VIRSYARSRLLALQQHARRRSPSLEYLFLEITQRCNLTCQHCGSDCVATSSHPDLPVEVVLDMARGLARALDPARVMMVITGGEALCHPGLFELGAGLHALGFRWGVVSNGWAWDADNAARARQAGLYSVAISLDGLEHSHDALRGRCGSHARALGALDLLLGAPRIPVVDVVTCVHPGNLHELEALHRLLLQRRVPAWRLFTIDPIGRGAQPGLQLDKAGFHELMRRIAGLRASGTMKINLGCGGYLGAPLNRAVRDHDYFCAAGIHIAGVMVNGDIMACPNNHRALRQGNLFEDDLLEVWRERFEPYRRRTHMRTGACHGCDQWGLCQGNDMHLWDPERGETRLCHYHQYELRDFEL
jgi:radical SAM protein with 4Fe4S-binding SPASM domain